MINFNDLPGDIKSMIYKVNKEAERDEAYSNKKKYNEVLTEWSEIVEGNDSITPSLILLYWLYGRSILMIDMNCIKKKHLIDITN